MDGSQPLWFRHRAEPRLDLRSRRGPDVPQDPVLTSAPGLMYISAITLLRVCIRSDRGPRIFIWYRAHGLGSRYCSRVALLCLGHPLGHHLTTCHLCERFPAPPWPPCLALHQDNAGIRLKYPFIGNSSWKKSRRVFNGYSVPFLFTLFSSLLNLVKWKWE